MYYINSEVMTRFLYSGISPDHIIKNEARQKKCPLKNFAGFFNNNRDLLHNIIFHTSYPIN